MQEVNRVFFHPLGLSLAMRVNEADHKFWGRPVDGSLVIIDDRDDPEGICFSPPPDRRLYRQVMAEFKKRKAARIAAMGRFIQRPA